MNYNKNTMKFGKKSYNGKINTNFHTNKIPRESSRFILVVLIDSVFRKDKIYYP